MRPPSLASISRACAESRGFPRISPSSSTVVSAPTMMHSRDAGVHLRRSRARFCFGEPRNHRLRCLARKGRLVDVRCANFKRNSRVAQDFRAARRRGCKNDFHLRVFISCCFRYEASKIRNWNFLWGCAFPQAPHTLVMDRRTFLHFLNRTGLLMRIGCHS